MGILGTILVSLYGGFSFGFTVIRLSQETVRADQILVEKLETLRLYDWSRITNAGFVPTNFTANFSTGSSTGAVYTGSLVIAKPSLSESYSNSLRQGTVALN